MNTVKKEAAQGFTQFEITTDLLRNLYKFNLTPVTKLVLLELTTHLNESKNGAVVFPSTGYIAEVLGIGLTAAKKAINDLIKEGFIIKSKRDKVRGNYNKYLLTPKVRNLTSEWAENESFKKSKSDLFMITNNNEQNKQQTELNNLPVKIYTNSKKEGGNVSKEEEILIDYAIKHGAKNVQAYVNTLKSTKSAEKIIKEYNKKNFIAHRAQTNYVETQLLIQKNKEYEKTAVSPKNCAAWVNFGNLHSI